MNGSKTSEHVFSASGTDVNGWLIDSGVTSHMSFERSDFVSYERVSNMKPVLTADGNALRVEGIGSVRFALANGDYMTLTEVLHVPELDKRLMSVPALTTMGADVLFKDNICIISHRGTPLFQIPRQCKSYVVSLEQANAVVTRMNSRGIHHDDHDKHEGNHDENEDDYDDHENDDSDKEDDHDDDLPSLTDCCDNDDDIKENANASLWHARLGHVSHRRLSKIIESCTGIPKSIVTVHDTICIRG